MNEVTINISEVNAVLREKTAEERIKWVSENLPLGLISTTSGGKTSRLLPHLIMASLDRSVPTIFVDTGFYPDSTYDTVKAMVQSGVDVRFYGAVASPTLMTKLHGDIWNMEGESFELFLNYVKHRPMNHAFTELKGKVWLRGIMGHQSDERSSRDIVEYKNGVYQVHPMIDWSKEMTDEYMNKHSLPLNEKHYDVTKGKQFDQECKISDNVGFIDGAGI